MNPKLKAILYPLLAALAGALASYFGTGCTAAQRADVRSTVDLAKETADCVLNAVDAAGDPAHLSAAEVLALAKAVRACDPRNDAPDAGAR